MKIHFIGDAGVSMSALKALAESRGATVSGSDSAHGGHDAKNVIGCDLAVYTNAVPQDNCELEMARELGIPTVERAEYLGELSRAYETVVAVAGCHGKSTATAMLGSIFPRETATVHVGVLGASRVGGDEYFITEACEYNRSFLRLDPKLGIILNIQYDHPDCYATYAELVDAYRAFAKRCELVLANGDDESCRTLENSVTFGTDRACKYRADNISNEHGYRTFDFVCGDNRTRVRLSAPGAHNVANATAALAAADMCGIPVADAARRLESFCGLPRRFDRRGRAYGKTVITDYAHHPSEIRATISTAREMFDSIAVVFQPHTYTRTQALASGFAQALSEADTVVLAPIFAAREKPVAGVTSELIADEMKKLGKHAECIDSFDGIIEFCKSLEEQAVIFTGAGDIDRAADLFANCT